MKSFHPWGWVAFTAALVASIIASIILNYVEPIVQTERIVIAPFILGGGLGSVIVAAIAILYGKPSEPKVLGITGAVSLAVFIGGALATMALVTNPPPTSVSSPTAGSTSAPTVTIIQSTPVSASAKLATPTIPPTATQPGLPTPLMATGPLPTTAPNQSPSTPTTAPNSAPSTPTTAPNSAPSTPTTAPNPPCMTTVTPINSAVSLVGGVADDIPGTAIASGAVVTSVIDLTGKTSDVYAVCLAAGQTFNVDLKSDSQVQIVLAYPGSRSFQANQLKTAVIFCQYDTACHQPTTVLNSGIYYLQVTARYGRSQYEMTVSVK